MFNITEMTKTAELVTQWAKAREFETGATYEGQFYKLVEEFGELVEAMNKNKDNKLEIVIDSVGDMLVVLSNMYLVNKQDFLHVLRAANGTYERNKLKSNKDTLAITMFLGRFATIILHGGNNKLIDDVVIDILLALHNICEDHKIDIAECFNIAYDEIKDRGGKMIDGKFIKSEDL